MLFQDNRRLSESIHQNSFYYKEGNYSCLAHKHIQTLKRSDANTHKLRRVDLHKIKCLIMDRCKVIDGYILVHKTSCEFVSLTRLNKAFCTGYDGVAVCRETTRIIPHFNAFFLNMALILLADVSKRKEA